jgi:hypothetical protein
MSKTSDTSSPAKVQRDQLDKLRIENERYMRDHPELNEAVQEFVFSVLKRKPDNVRDFCVEYFSKPPADN